MKKALPKRRPLVPLGAATICLAAWMACMGDRAPRDAQGNDQREVYPNLFRGSSGCPTQIDQLVTAARLEERARLRADRYAYDPRDGVLSVLRYQDAEACYRAADDRDAASRVSLMAARLSARIDADYAAARLSLINALARERWSEALRIVSWLLLLTDHIERDGYVEWLHEIEGRVAARAATAS